jgi:uncharacterized protein YyaL (SSP411 family)
MISSLSLGSRVLNEPRYRDAAQNAADFLLAKVRRADGRPEVGRASPSAGRLMHRYRDGEVSIPGFLDDYAFFTHGLIDLYEATFYPGYLAQAQILLREMVRLFWDEKGGGFFMTGRDGEQLISRSKELYDGAIPSGNSVAALSLLRMARITMDRDMEKRAQAALDAFSGQAAQYPSGLDFALGPTREIVIAAGYKGDQAEPFVQAVYSKFIPNKVVLFLEGGGEAYSWLVRLSPFVEKQGPLNSKTTVYVCKNYVCDLPVTEVEKLRGQLEQ